MGELSGKVAIVTGASKGIGAGIARAFGKAGAAVAVNYVSSKVDADRVVDDIVRAGRQGRRDPCRRLEGRRREASGRRDGRQARKTEHPGQ